jgi:nicotinate-nucleotide adenylyltransferase
VRLRIYYGGTFDPVHNGHLAIAVAAQAAFNTDVVLLPSADPPHRPPASASAEQRATMVDLAIAGHPGLRCDRRELRRSGKS